MILLALALAAAPMTKQERAASLLSPEQVAAMVMVEGEGALDPDIWIETRNFLPKDNNDRWLRARIDKVTGAVEYQIYFIITQSRDAFRAHSLTFLGENGLREAKIDKIDHDVTCPNSVCYITEHAFAQLTRGDLEYAAKGEGEWVAKLFGQSDSGEILTFKSEIAGLLIAVDRELAELQAGKAQK